uniref:Endonuclease III n=1 Tax=Eiseniibacteriota bacterium TaxID=2212470 RepID=A0A832I3K9_UNCEI
MPRKSPRARRKPDDTPRLPGAGRPRATPGRRRAARAAAPPAGAHAPKGARGTAARPAAAAGAGARRPAARPARPKRAGRPAPAAGRRAAAARPAARRARFAPPDPARVARILDLLDRAHPDARCALDFANPLQLLVATILSAQCTDERVNKVTPALFARWPDAAALASATQAEVEEAVRPTGFFRMKARAIREAAADIVARHGGEVPRTLEALTALRGVGRKTANVVLGNAFGIPGLVVDTHVTRLAKRLGLTNETDAVKIEFALMPVIPRERWTIFSHWLILHGRRVCHARKPKCSACPLAPHCPRVGVTASQ